MTWNRLNLTALGLSPVVCPGIHHGVSPQHLQAYLNEFTFRFNRRFYPFNAFRSLLGIAGDVTAPTYAELYAKKPRTPTDSRVGH